MIHRIGRYLIQGEIARGGMGVVYRARDPDLRRDVALKLLRADRPMDPALEARFEREVLVLARLRHPNIVRIHSVELHEGAPFFVQDLVPGQTLAERIGREGKLPIDESVTIVGKLAGALQLAHDEGIVHRDLKPSNVIMAGAEPVLIDFGIAKDMSASLSGDLTQSGLGIGTPGYWSPEQALGEREGIGPSSDVYSLGALLYALLVGKPPFVGGNLQGNVVLTVSQPAAPPSELRDDVDPQLDAICLKCLEKEPADRYASAAEIGDDLARYRRGEVVLARPRRSSRTRAVLFLAVVLAAVTAAVLLRSAPVDTEAPRVSVDETAPVLHLTEPGDWTFVSAERATLSGRVEGDSPVRITAGLESTTIPAGAFSLDVALRVGVNEIEITCEDASGNAGTTLRLHLLRPPPKHDTEALLGRYQVQAGEYHVTDAVRVAANQTLVLPAGVRVRFGRAGAILCRGQLWCVGTAEKPVLLEAKDEGWQGVRVEGASAFAAVGWTTLSGATPDPLSGLLAGEASTRSRGGGLTVLEGARLVLADSELRDCTAPSRSDGGGGLHIVGDEGSPSVADCVRTTFTQCEGKKGGGVYRGDCAELRLTDCTFDGNRAALRGGGLAAEGAGVLEASEVTFRNNGSAATGGGAALDCPARLLACLFAGNSAEAGGGGLAARGGGLLQLVGVSFKRNVSQWNGGGAHLSRPATLRDCVFEANHTRLERGEVGKGGGGGLALSAGGYTLRDVHFLGNTSALAGGAIAASKGAVVRVQGCTFRGNEAGNARGGAVRIFGGEFRCEDTEFTDNRAGEGGAAWGGDSLMELQASRFVRNHASRRGGGLSIAGDSSLTVVRCVFEENQSAVAPALALGTRVTFDEQELKESGLVGRQAARD